VLRRTVDVFAGRAEITAIVIVRARAHHEMCAGALDGLETAFPDIRFSVVDGGPTRTESVRNGMEALAKEPPYTPRAVLIHDAARPFVTAAVIDRVEAALLSREAAAPALAIPDALKHIDEDGNAGDDAPREALRAVQTPQGFAFAPLLAAYRALAPDSTFTDDIAVVRGAGLDVALVAGDPDNIKLTYPEDFERAEQRLAQLPTSEAGQRAGRIAVGTGFDAHRIGPGDGVTLCGVSVPAAFSLIGHSDADVGLHALTDAILGALGAGDIGDHFPPSDEKWKDADSRTFLAHAALLAADAGALITHVDVTLICEQPKVKPHRDAMRNAVAETLDIPLAHVSVKATTTERMGFAGRGEGIAAMATATLLFDARPAETGA